MRQTTSSELERRPDLLSDLNTNGELHTEPCCVGPKPLLARKISVATHRIAKGCEQIRLLS